MKERKKETEGKKKIIELHSNFPTVRACSVFSRNKAASTDSSL